MSVLNRTSIEKAMSESDYSKKLLITPLLTKDQIGTTSVDVRLGSSIIVPKKTYVERHDVTNSSEIRQIENRLYEKTTLRYGHKFILHPNQLILGVTFEYLSIPENIFCVIMSRSSWGRLGLIIATAAAVAPGYKGCLTLELVNVSESPIALYPGLPIGQLVFYDVLTQGKFPSYEGRYDCPTEAELPKFFSQESDRELSFWRDFPNNV